jgi:hypothetical protein
MSLVRARWITVIGVAAVACCVAVAAPAAAILSVSPLPDTEPADEFPFYKVADSDFHHVHGTLLKKQPLTGPAALAHAGDNQLVIYESAAVRDDTPVSVSGIVALPKRKDHPVPDGGYPVISWAHGTVGVADKCAPSRDSEGLADPTKPSDVMHTHRKINQAPHALLNAFLDQGWAVVMSDYQGSGTKGPHPYLNGEAAGRNVLDIVRAARQLHNTDPSHPVLSARFATVGHSQGGQAALFAAHLTKTWTPDLQIRGVSVMAPSSFQAGKLREFPKPPIGGLWLLRTLTGTILAKNVPFLPMAVVGALAYNPGINLDGIFTPRGRSLFTEGIDRDCRVELSQPGSWGNPFPGSSSDYFIGRQPDTPIPEDLKREFEKMHPNKRIEAPIRISQTLNDNRVNSDNTKELVEELDATNTTNHVAYTTYADTPDPDLGPDLAPHFGILTTADIQPTIAWLKDRFAKAPKH